jgi:6-phosphogluconolactonase
MAEPKIVVLNDPPDLFVHAAEEIAHFAGEAISTHGEFMLGLSGGSTPAATYELLATRFQYSVDWKGVQFFWSDERCVPPDNPESNYGMANRTLLSKIGLKPEQVHRMRGELPPSQGATEYEQELQRAFSVSSGDVPRFDLIMLGLGDNRHTASLFPGDPSIHETKRTVVAVNVDAEPRNRLSFTPPILNNAQRVMFLAAGAKKAEAIRDIIEGPRDPDKFPAQIVVPGDGELVWFLDKAAASLLSKR